MMQTSDTRPGYDLSSTGAARPLFWGLLPESTVRAILMVIPDVAGKQPFEMRLVDGDHVIQQLAPTTADKPFGNPILPRATYHGPDGDQIHGASYHWNLGAVLGVMIEDEKLDGGLVRKCLSQLLRDPGTGRMARDVEVEDASSIVANDEEAVEHVEGDGGHREKVHGRDGLAMIAQKG